MLIRQSIHTQKIAPYEWCQSLRLNWKNRYTLINREGKVLCDSHLPPDKLPTQIENEEVRKALLGMIGYDIRGNKATESDDLFGALTIRGTYKGLEQTLVIRQSISLKKLKLSLAEIDRIILIFLFPFLLLTSLISIWIYLQGSTPLLQILNKVKSMSMPRPELIDVDDDEDDDPKELLLEHRAEENTLESDLITAEQTLDRVQQDLEKYIDELYNENEKIRTVMRGISDSILAIGLNENILFANRQFRKNFVSKDFRGKDLSKFKLWEINRDVAILEQFKECIEKKEYVKKRKIHLPVKGGKRFRYFDIRMNPLLNNKGEIFGAVGVLQDISDQLLAEQMREDFVANVSHEVRTPLTALKGYVQILKDTVKKEDEESQLYLNKIEQNSDRLTHLFSDILNLSVIESKQVVPKETIFVEEITKNTINNIKQSFPNKDIKIDSNFQIEKVWANPQLLEQVLTNLIENAYKYTLEGGTVKINWSTDPENNFEVFEVTDSGIGISKEHLPRLFERFYRVDHGRSREMGGTGLGLAIVKHIVQIHNGKIFVNSKPNTGTTFTVKIPAHY